MVIKRFLSPWMPRSHPSRLHRGLGDRLQDNPQLRFETLGEVEAAAALGVRIDANQASQEDWLRLPGLSIHQARRLAQLTQAGVQFHCLEDLAAALGISLGQLQGYGSILQFCFYERDEAPLALNPNGASQEALCRLPGIGEELAQAIAQQREAQGPFRDLVEFQQRLRLEPAVIEHLMHYLRF